MSGFGSRATPLGGDGRSEAGNGAAAYGAGSLLLRVVVAGGALALLRSALVPLVPVASGTALLLFAATALLLFAATQWLVGTVLRQRRADFERRVAARVVDWLDAIDGRGPEPPLGDAAAVAALARLCAEAGAEDAARLAELYRSSGLLRADAATAQRGDGDERLAAIERLGRMRHPTTLEVLVRVTQSRDAQAARRAAAALARTLAASAADDDALRHHLVPVLRDERFGTEDVEGVVRRLGPRAGAALDWLLEPARPAERRVAALRALRDPALRPHAARALAALGDPLPEVRAAAIAAAAGLGPDGDPASIVPALRAPDAPVRAAAARACAELPFDLAREPLLAALGDADWQVRRNAAVGLSAFGAAGRAALEARAATPAEEGAAGGDAAGADPGAERRAAEVARAALRGRGDA